MGTLSDISARIVSGGTPSRSVPEYYEGGTIPWIKTGETKNCFIFDTEEKITEAALENSSAKLIPKNTIVVAMYGDGGTAGQAAITKVPACTNQACCNLVIDPDKASYLYVYYYLKASYKNLVALKLGGSQQNLNAATIKRFPIRLPEIEAQKKIAAILTAYDDLIENNRQRIALLEAMAEEIYREWFVRLRFPGHEHTPVHKGVPEGWEEKRIAEVVLFKSGFPFKSSTYQTDAKYGVVTIKNVHDGRFIADCSDHVASAPAKLPKHCFLKDGDILMSLTGNVGRVCLVQGNNLLLNQRVALLQPTKHLHSHYLYWAFRQKSILTFCELISTGAAQQNLSPVKLSRQTLIYPSDKIVESFQSTVQPLMSQVAVLQQSVSLLAKTRDLLLNRLISGKLRVDDLDIQFPPSMSGAA